jgi:hypothetical protein
MAAVASFLLLTMDDAVEIKTRALLARVFPSTSLVTFPGAFTQSELCFPSQLA